MTIISGSNKYMMYNNWGYGMGFGFGWIFMIIFWGLVIWGFVALMRHFFGGEHNECCGRHKQDKEKDVFARKNSALDILEERYAKGEINKEEYEERKKVLSK